MAYTYLQNRTKGVASQVQANFEHIGSGNLLPMGGTNLDYTTSVYDLGSDTYKWNNIYTNNITNKYNEEIHQFENIVNYILSSATSRIEFSGLNGDTDILYKINCHFILNQNISSAGAIDYINLMINNDSASNYVYEYLNCYRNNIYANIESYTSFFIFRDYATISRRVDLNILLFSKINYERAILVNAFSGYTSGAFVCNNIGGIWNNIINTITSLTFLTPTSFSVGSNILIDARR